MQQIIEEVSIHKSISHAPQVPDYLMLLELTSIIDNGTKRIDYLTHHGECFADIETIDYSPFAGACRFEE